MTRMFNAVGIRHTLLCVTKQWRRPGESLVIVLLEIFHCLKSHNIALPLLQYPHKVSLLLRQIALAPLVYLVFSLSGKNSLRLECNT